MSELLAVEELSIHLHNVNHHAEMIKLVNNLSFSISKGECVCLLGESGSGKSMTALAIMGLLPANIKLSHTSQISYKHQNLNEFSESQMRLIRGKEIAMIFQEPMTSLNPVLTVGHQVSEALRCHFNLISQDARQRAIDLFKQVGIADPALRYDEYPHQLSGGMKQRVMIAMALACEPSILIADEATTALDVTIQAQLLLLLKKIQSENNMGLLFITHDLALASQIADKVLVMQTGELVEAAAAKDFFSKPKKAYSQELLAALPSLENNNKVNNFSDNKKDNLKANNIKIHFPIQKGLLKKTVGVIHAVDGVDLTLYEGETLALVGESGCGKTTLAKSLVQSVELTEGEINVANLATEYSSIMLRQTIQFVFQDPFSSMNPRMMVGDIILEGVRALRLKSKDEQNALLLKLLDQVGLPNDSLYRYPHEFSGGQRQRICIARALAVNPSILICDEPTSALDVSVQAQILELLKSLQRELGLSMLFISHDLAVVGYMAHRIAVMYLGRIVEQGSTLDILQTPKHPYTQALLNAVPALNKPMEAFAGLQGEIPSPRNPPTGCHFSPRCTQAKAICRQTYPDKITLLAGHEVACCLYEDTR